MVVKHAAMGIENNDSIIQGCCVNLQLAHRKECKIDELVQCVISNCIYNIQTFRPFPHKLTAFNYVILF